MGRHGTARFNRWQCNRHAKMTKPNLSPDPSILSHLRRLVKGQGSAGRSSPLETIFPKVHSFVQTNGGGIGRVAAPVLRPLQASAIQCTGSNTTLTAAYASAGDLVRSVGSVTGLNQRSLGQPCGIRLQGSEKGEYVPIDRRGRQSNTTLSEICVQDPTVIPKGGSDDNELAKI